MLQKNNPEQQFVNLEKKLSETTICEFVEKIVQNDNLQDDWSTMTNYRKIVQMDNFQRDTTGTTICKKKNNSQWQFAKES